MQEGRFQKGLSGAHSEGHTMSWKERQCFCSVWEKNLRGETMTPREEWGDGDRTDRQLEAPDAGPRFAVTHSLASASFCTWSLVPTCQVRTPK